MNSSVKKFLNFPIIKIIAGVSVILFILLLFKFLLTDSVFRALIAPKNIADTVKNYVMSAIMILSYYYLFRFYDKRNISELSAKHLIPDLAGGFIFGVASLSLVILILYFLGYYKEIGIANYPFLLTPFSALVTAALFEEICFRIIAYRILEEWLGTYYALALIAIVFTLPHLFNNSITVLSVLTMILFSFAVGLMYTYTRRLWLPFAYHLGWNFAQPLFGSNLSGENNVGSIINAKLKGPTLFIGSNFGIEDSIFSVILLAMLSVLLFILCKRKGKIVPISARSRGEENLKH